MAIITKIKVSKNKYSSRVPTNCEAEYNEFINEETGQKYVRLQTFGSNHRQHVKKQSQVLHINKEIAKELITLLKDSFDI